MLTLRGGSLWWWILSVVVAIFYCFLLLLSTNDLTTTTAFVLSHHGPLNHHHHHFPSTTTSSSSSSSISRSNNNNNNNYGMFHHQQKQKQQHQHQHQQQKRCITTAFLSSETTTTTDNTKKKAMMTISSEYIPENLMTYQHRVKIYKKNNNNNNNNGGYDWNHHHHQEATITRRKRFFEKLKSLFTFLRKIVLLRKRSSSSSITTSSSASSADSVTATTTTILDVTYDYDLLEIGSNTSPTSTTTTTTTTTTGIILIQPIGVGIAKWFYQRLFGALDNSTNTLNQKFIVIAPDLIGCGSSTMNITTIINNNNNNMDNDNSLLKKVVEDATNKQQFPLLNISDWTDQIVDLMYTIEKTRSSDYNNHSKIDRWCIVANGGCSPIALQVAARSVIANNGRNISSSNLEEGTSPSTPRKVFTKPVTNVILSSVPRLPFFVNATDNDPNKTIKSYRRLCGIIGNLFWWYSCKNDGKFIQTFSEKNLVSDPNNLGVYWQSNCYNTAYYNKQSRYSTFAFLAGTLQDGCSSSLNTLIQYNNNNNNKKNKMQIDTIKGRDTRRNQARSWFWQKKNRRRQRRGNKKQDGDGDEEEENQQQPRKTFRDYLEENGLGGREYMIDGRVSLAHEDADGYCDALIRCCCSSEE